jgi:hypothetical protein
LEAFAKASWVLFSLKKKERPELKTFRTLPEEKQLEKDSLLVAYRLESMHAA